MRLVRVANPGAVCLDGSPGVFYWHPATDPKHANDWILSFKGDGWCFDEQDCLGRSKTGFGGSDFLANVTNGWNGGVLSGDDKDFGGFNKVILENCDGASLTGDLTDPLMVMDHARPGEPAVPIYFRGRQIRDAIFETLLDPQEPYGMGKAENVLLTGCSSGGLAAYLHSDWAHALMSERAPNLQRFKTLGVSGFFLQHDSVEGKPVYQTQMANVMKIQNSSGALNPDCLAARPADMAWECMFAQNSYAVTKVPTFVENSALDMWQMWCIYGAAPIAGFPNTNSSMNGNCSAPIFDANGDAWKPCVLNPENCTDSQMGKMNDYIDDYVAALTATTTFHKNGNGAFIHSCHDHCDGISGGWSIFKINNQSMGEVGRAWWESDGKDSAAKHTKLPCQYNEHSTPRRCNPTCPKDEAMKQQQLMVATYE